MLDKCAAALRSASVRRPTGHISILDRSIWGNMAFAKSNLRQGNISPDQFAAYKGLWGGDSSSVDLLVFLDVPPQVCAQRCNARGVVSEGGIDLGSCTALAIFRKFL